MAKDKRIIKVRFIGDQTPKEPTCQLVKVSTKPAMMQFDLFGYKKVPYWKVSNG